MTKNTFTFEQTTIELSILYKDPYFYRARRINRTLTCCRPRLYEGGGERRHPFRPPLVLFVRESFNWIRKIFISTGITKPRLCRPLDLIWSTEHRTPRYHYTVNNQQLTKDKIVYYFFFVHILNKIEAFEYLAKEIKPIIYNIYA